MDYSTVLGEGLWGKVLDLQDGTVLKLTRLHCAGLGNGLHKLQREIAVLQAIEQVSRPSLLATARVIDSGNCSEQSPYADDDYEFWLRTTRLPGHLKTVSELELVTEQKKGAIAHSIVLALANTHSLLAQTSPKLKLPTAQEDFQIILRAIQKDADATGYAMQLLDWLKALKGEASFIVHGDFNISNLLFENDTACAVVDFAETHIGFPEEDLAAIVAELPTYKAKLIEAFEQVTGRAIRENYLNYGLAIKAFLSFTIARRLKAYDSSERSRHRLEQLLQQVR